jgi:hypothetical protein
MVNPRLYLSNRLAEESTGIYEFPACTIILARRTPGRHRSGDFKSSGALAKTALLHDIADAVRITLLLTLFCPVALAAESRRDGT